MMKWHDSKWVLGIGVTFAIILVMAMLITVSTLANGG